MSHEALELFELYSLPLIHILCVIHERVLGFGVLP